MYCQIAVINYDVYFVFVAAILFVLASRHGKNVFAYYICKWLDAFLALLFSN